jgi:myo-inositol-1(or 4)-monophosphatase
LPEADLDLLVEAAEAAGRAALRFWRKHPRVWEKPDGSGPVSEADLAANAVLAERLRPARPDYGWLSEEDPDTHRDGTERQFVVDPIDGTRAFLAGEELFAVSLAVVDRGRPVAGVVHLPARARTYAAAVDGPARLNGSPIRARDWSGMGMPQVLTSGHALQPQFWPGGVPEVRKSFRPSMAYRLCLVAEGAVDGMLSLRPCWDWDIAAGALIAERAGARVTDRQGHPLGFEARPPQSDGLVAAGPRLHADLIARLTGPAGD